MQIISGLWVFLYDDERFCKCLHDCNRFSMGMNVWENVCMIENVSLWWWTFVQMFAWLWAFLYDCKSLFLFVRVCANFRQDCERLLNIGIILSLSLCLSTFVYSCFCKFLALSWMFLFIVNICANAGKFMRVSLWRTFVQMFAWL